MTTALIVIAILVFLIVVHELGHFLAAKLFRVRVEEFGIGYPPRALTLGKIKETVYTLNWIPFGGFVRLFGETGTETHGKGSFADAHRGVQAFILVAGVAMNVIAAWALFVFALHAGIPRAVETVPPGEVAHLFIAHVVPDSPANVAGLAVGDEVVDLRDAAGDEISAYTPAAFAEFVQARGGEALRLTYLREEQETTTEIIPAHAVIPEETGRPALGVAIVLVSTDPLPMRQAVGEAFSATKDTFAIVGRGLWGILTKALAGEPSLSDVVGPVGLFSIVGDAARSGVGDVLRLAAFISVNLAIINLVPIPALDGGRLALLGVESVMRRSAPKIALQIFNAFGIALIVLLMVAVTYQDVARLIFP